MQGRYEQLLSGLTVLESNLHKNLIEHIASEINLGTVTNLATAKTWLHNSFFFQRIQRNPSHYASVLDTKKDQSWQERADDLVSEAVATLSEAGMISIAGNNPLVGLISIADLGEIMSRVRDSHASQRSRSDKTSDSTTFAFLRFASPLCLPLRSSSPCNPDEIDRNSPRASHPEELGTRLPSSSLDSDSPSLCS